MAHRKSIDDEQIAKPKVMRAKISYGKTMILTKRIIVQIVDCFLLSLCVFMCAVTCMLGSHCMLAKGKR